LSMIPLGAVISKWFVRRRGFAIGIAAAGIGFAGIVAPPIIGIVLIPTFGWRTAYQILALLGLVLVIIPAQLVISRALRRWGCIQMAKKPL